MAADACTRSRKYLTKPAWVKPERREQQRDTLDQRPEPHRVKPDLLEDQRFGERGEHGDAADGLESFLHVELHAKGAKPAEKTAIVQATESASPPPRPDFQRLGSDPIKVCRSNARQTTSSLSRMGSVLPTSREMTDP